MSTIDARHPRSDAAAALFAGPGEMRARCRALDWAATPLGPVEAWPASLRTAVGTILAAPQPMWIGWGPAYIQLYNDAYARLLDAEHDPSILGRSTAETWPETWPRLQSDLDAILAGGPALSHADAPLPFRRGGRRRDLFFTYSYSAIPKASAPHDIGGVLWIGLETSNGARGEAALGTSEARYRSLFETMSEGVAINELVRDEQGRVVDARYLELNPAYDRQTGFDRTQALGRLASEVFPAYFRPWLEIAERVVRTGQPERIEHFVPDNSRWFAFNFTRFGGADGFVVFYDDITARKQAEAALRESEERFRRLFELGLIGMAITSPTKGCLAVNDRICEILGYSRDDLLHKTWAEMTHPDDLAADTAQFEHVLAGESDGYSLDKRWIRGDGRVIDSVISVSAVRRADRTVEYFVALLDDVTERKRTADALRESEARFRTLADLAPALLWEEDPTGQEVALNPRWREYTGQTLEQTHRGGWLDAIHPEDRANTARVFDVAYETRRPLEVQHRIRRYDGAYRWFLVRQLPVLEDAGRVTRWIGAAVDIHAQRMAFEEVEQLVAERTTERDALRRQLAEVEEAERRRLARELHDQLGQELTALRLGLEHALQLTHDGFDAALLRERLAHLQALTARVTGAARQIALELRPPELDDLGLESALETYVLQWSARCGVAAEVEIAGAARGRGLPVETSSAVYRIVQEALTNVAKHAQATEVSVLLEHGEAAVRAIVEDDGRGFDPEPTVARARAERRLGLAGMQERAALAGGAVTVESSPGSGTAVYVRLPVGGPAGGAPTAGALRDSSDRPA